MKAVSQSDKEHDIWKNGVVLTFDLKISDLEKYYSQKSPKSAYGVVKSFLVKNGFEHRKDSDYKNGKINKIETLRLLFDFSKKNPWFLFCLQKLDISPNVHKLDISKDLMAFRDEEWAKQHLAKDKTNQNDKSNKQTTMDYFKSEIAKMKNEVRKNSDGQSMSHTKNIKDRTDR